MTGKAWMVFFGVGALACSPQDDETAGVGQVAVVEADSGAHHPAGHGPAAQDSGAPEMAGAVHHSAPASAARSDGDHAAHAAAPAEGHRQHPRTAGEGADVDHAQHTPRRATAGAEHGAHAQLPAAAPRDQQHGADSHARVAADTAQAAHPVDERHAAHAPPADEADTAHALHRAMHPSDTAHPMQAADTSAHAMHQRMHPGDTSNMDHGAHGDANSASQPRPHEMAMISLGGGWMAIGMAQVFPTVTVAVPSDDGTPLDEVGWYLTQPALMLNVESPESRVSLRTTLNFEGLTQPDGELTFGGWGEGFIDKRHPHTYLHEAMLSVNVWTRDGGGFSLSAGKGFAPYGTDDPMSRPVVKYPTNHHLSQILERWTLNAVYSTPRWSVEAGVFGGNEPTSPSDLSNIESFANSWSTRVARRFGTGAMGAWEGELSGSYGYVVEEHGDEEAATHLYNVAFRHEHEHGFGRMYYLTEASLSDPAHHRGYWSVLGEGSLMLGAHNPYGRIEYATRPEYPREGLPGSTDFFRYDHDEEPIGATRWLTVVAGYGFTATSLPFSARPYVEAQWNHVSEEEGGIDPYALFGRSSFLSLSAGFRLFLGGEPMRMGAYGVLDSMTLMHRMMMGEAPGAQHTDH